MGGVLCLTLGFLKICSAAKWRHISLFWWQLVVTSYLPINQCVEIIICAKACFLTLIREDSLNIVIDLPFQVGQISRTLATFAQEKEPLINKKSDSRWKVKYNGEKLRNQKTNLPNLQITYNCEQIEFPSSAIIQINSFKNHFHFLAQTSNVYPQQIWGNLKNCLCVMTRYSNIIKR